MEGGREGGRERGRKGGSDREEEMPTSVYKVAKSNRKP